MTHYGQQFTRKVLRNHMKRETLSKIIVLERLILMLQLFKGKYLVGV